MSLKGRRVAVCRFECLDAWRHASEVPSSPAEEKEPGLCKFWVQSLGFRV